MKVGYYMIKNRKKILISFLLFIITFGFLIIFENKNLELNTYSITSENLPDDFSGFRIVHISDLHNAEFGDGNSKLIGMIKEAEPDIIAITGDIIDSRRTDIDIALAFLEEVLKIAPCYYVSGNHESRIEEYDILKKKMINAGVMVLENQISVISRSNSAIKIIGISDPSFNSDYLFGDEEFVMKSQLEETVQCEDAFTIMLSHRPEFFELYIDYTADLVLSGHAHGGQFILPLFGGLFAPGQGFFPKYDAGHFEKNGTNMVVSRGIGNSIIPLRVNNRPEVILVELNSA